MNLIAPCPPTVYLCERCGFKSTSWMSFDYHKTGCTLRCSLDAYQAAAIPPEPAK